MRIIITIITLESKACLRVRAALTPYNPPVRRHANFVATVSAGLLVIGFGMIAMQQASEAGRQPTGG